MLELTSEFLEYLYDKENFVFLYMLEAVDKFNCT
jgi:hypothetical protein